MYLWVVDVLLGAVASKSLGGYLELTRSIAKSEERKTPQQDTDGLSRELLQSTDIDRLRVVTKPVTKVYTFDIKLVEFGITPCNHNQLQECVLNISVTIVDSVDLRHV